MKNAGKAILTALGWFVFSISLILVIVAIASDNTVVTVFLIIVCIFVCPLTYKILLKTPKSDSRYRKIFKGEKLFHLFNLKKLLFQLRQHLMLLQIYTETIMK